MVQLPQRRLIQPQAFANLTLGVLDFAVKFVGRYIDEPRRQFSNKSFKTEAISKLAFQCSVR